MTRKNVIVVVISIAVAIVLALPAILHAHSAGRHIAAPASTATSQVLPSATPAPSHSKPPVVKPPVVKLPVVKPPVVKPPVVKPPVVKPPVVKPPVVKPPVVKLPVVKPPVVKLPVVKPPVVKPVIVTVHKGDSLWAIALRHYGNGSDWPKIYAANHKVVGANPNLIFAGQRLTLPGGS